MIHMQKLVLERTATLSGVQRRWFASVDLMHHP
jgi:hypothetical protein